VTVASGALFGLVPAIGGAGANPLQGLGWARGSSGSRASMRPQQLLVSFQFAVSVVLLTGAVLVIASFDRLLGVERGFDSEAVVVATVAPSAARYDTPERIDGLYARVLEEVRAIPGGTHASTTYSPPLVGNGFRTSVVSEGQEQVDGERFWAGTVVVGQDYFATNGIRLTSGRKFASTDRLGEPLVVIVNQAMADALWPGGDPIGKRFEFSGGLRGSADSFDPAFFPEEFMTVVGVAANIRRESLMQEARPEYYRPHSQISWGFQ